MQKKNQNINKTNENFLNSDYSITSSSKQQEHCNENQPNSNEIKSDIAEL